jgi:hypothetical protein
VINIQKEEVFSNLILTANLQIDNNILKNFCIENSGHNEDRISIAFNISQ